jgi:tetratricopeptide (TPR) repeat protein
VKKLASYHVSFTLFLIALIVAACSTTKNKFMNRAYHNMTSRYNGYFYARESMKDAQTKIEKTYVDDYSQLLPVFRLPNTPETKGCYTDLEKATKKASSVIDKHAITKPRPKNSTTTPEEIPGAVKWIDENYMIIGQVHYYKGEYIAALEIFDYVIQKYSKFPCKYDAILWKARTEVELGDYTQAESLLDVIGHDKACPPKLQADVKATYADIYMRTGNYPNAIKNLEEAITLTKKSKKTVARYTYILAQLYEKTGKEKDAYEAYGRVIALHPQYDMLFNAKLSRARLSASDPKNRTASKKELQKMLDDVKNLEFQDQIYYTLAQLEMGAGNKAGAIVYYRLSISTSVTNNKQKALSYLALGDLYFADTDYKNAQAYYDSTMTFLPQEYPNYDAINEKRKSLTSLVRYINLISSEDSLQKVVKNYGSDTTQLYAYIDKLIDRAKAEDQKKKEEQELKLQGGGGVSSGGGSGQQQSGSWYFYNQSTISFGIGEFTRKWGNRKLEDNWRRENKESVIEDDDNPENGKDSSSAKVSKEVNSKYTRAYYLKNLPLTSDLQSKSDEKIADAYYNLGTIYKEQMKNNTKAVEAFESLCERFPKHKYALPSHFQLYKIYTVMKNQPKADQHKYFILNNYPESEYAKLIQNPDYEVQKLGTKEKLYTYYDSTYSVYTRKNYPEVLTRCNYADTTFGKKNELAAKFGYLRAVSLGKTQGTPAMEAELTRIIANFPTDPIRPQVQALLDAIHKQNGQTVVAPKDTATPAAGPAYVMKDNAEFQCMIIVDAGKGAHVNDFNIALSDFNKEFYGSANLTISTISLDNQHQLILVKKFDSKTSALDYYNMLKTKPQIFANLAPAAYQVMMISTENLSLFLKDKKIDTYKSFFDKNFTKK